LENRKRDSERERSARERERETEIFWSGRSSVVVEHGSVILMEGFYLGRDGKMLDSRFGV
jgi:hypothetical protein